MKDEKSTRKEQNREKNSFNPMRESSVVNDVYAQAMLSDAVVERIRDIIST